jgi:hypothetical protein
MREREFEGGDGYCWLRIRSSSRLFLTQQWTLGFHQGPGISCISERLFGLKKTRASRVRCLWSTAKPVLMNIFGREGLSIIYYFVENSIQVCCSEKRSVAMLNMIRRRKAALCHHVSLCNVYLCSHFDLSRAFIPLIHADTSRLRNSVCATPIRPQQGMKFVDTLNTVLQVLSPVTSQ